MRVAIRKTFTVQFSFNFFVFIILDGCKCKNNLYVVVRHAICISLVSLAFSAKIHCTA